MSEAWCASPYEYSRRRTREVLVGDVGVGGRNPIRIQSMTTPATTDTVATVAQITRLVEAGCEIVRLTVPTSADARSLPIIRRELALRKIKVPLVADIHFSPGAALKAVEHVEKIRVNPGNYADRKQFSIREYSEAEYDTELARIEETFKPLVLRAKELGVAMRIGTNHGSLSDRIVNRYGDSPVGMVESALEFVRICEVYGYRDLIISMKSSNPVVTIEAYRLLAARMAGEGMDYPFHLGVTEAGDGEDGRVKSAIGIGSLLADGIGDTIRVSLTEDPALEIPVAQRLVAPFNRFAATDPEAQKTGGAPAPRALTAREMHPPLPFDPFSYARRRSHPARFGPCALGGENPVRVEVRLLAPLADAAAIRQEIDAQAGPRVPLETRADLVEASVLMQEDISRFVALRETIAQVAPRLALSARLAPDVASAFVLELARQGAAEERSAAGPRPEFAPGRSALTLVRNADRVVLPAGALVTPLREGRLELFDLPHLAGAPILLEGDAASLLGLLEDSLLAGDAPTNDAGHGMTGKRSGVAGRAPTDDTGQILGRGAAGANRPLSGLDPAALSLGELALSIPCVVDDPEEAPIVPGLRSRALVDDPRAAGVRTDRPPTAVRTVQEYRLLAAGLHRLGLDLPIVLACDSAPAGRGDGDEAPPLGVSIALGSLLCDGIGDAVQVTSGDATRSRALAFTILQGARVRISKTEFISCPSCGRTLFDLEETTRRIKQRTAHLKGLKIAIMGCVVNGPGEMADADFGYVGWGADKIALFVGKEMVARDIPMEEADDRLVALIQEHGKWQDPPVLGNGREVPVNLDL